jgi:hypothetical protein
MSCKHKQSRKGPASPKGLAMSEHKQFPALPD